MKSHMEMIKEFHEKFELEYNGPPRDIKVELHCFRKGFMQEELDEYHEAWCNSDLEKQLDSLVDLVYVALGTAYMQGFNFDEAFKRVHEANMKKVRVQKKEDSSRLSIYDVVKPEGWESPFLTDLVRNNDDVE